MVNKRRIFSIFHLFLLFYQGMFTLDVAGLQLITVIVPRYKLHNEEAILECHYKLENESLYAVKWYKDNEEFYRYVPRSYPPVYSYKIEGVKVDLEKSDNRKVMLKRLIVKSSGIYRCEVSAEAPSFASAQKEGRMEVILLPKSGPHITGEKREYQIGDQLDLNCTSGKSFPPSLLRWFINDKSVNEKYVMSYSTNNNNNSGHRLNNVVLGLQITIDNSHFINGSMKVKCVTTVSTWKGDSESILQKIDNREALLLVRNHSSLKTAAHHLVAQMLIILVITKLFQ